MAWANEQRKGIDQIAHLWAEQNLTEGADVKRLKKNTGEGSNFFWRDSTIYSYGGHFPIARVIQTKKGKAVLFTRRGYSVTTSGHKSTVRDALRGRDLPTFYVDRPDEMPREAETKAYYEKAIEGAFLTASRAKARAEYELSYAVALVEEGNNFAKYFGFKCRFKAPAPAKLAELKARAKEQSAKKAAETKIREAARKLQVEKSQAWHLAALERWTLGLPEEERPADILNSYMYSMDHMETRLRVVGDKVETSRGAEVPLDHAKRVLKLIRKIQASGVGYVKNGHTEHVGEFAIDRIDPDGTVKAGCHTILAAEIERFAKVLGEE